MAAMEGRYVLWEVVSALSAMRTPNACYCAYANGRRPLAWLPWLIGFRRQFRPGILGLAEFWAVLKPEFQITGSWILMLGKSAWSASEASAGRQRVSYPARFYCPVLSTTLSTPSAQGDREPPCSVPASLSAGGDQLLAGPAVLIGTGLKILSWCSMFVRWSSSSSEPES
jgi:hypothetical protein